MIGENILHYKVLAKLGEGGMGVVYKALDTELNREVAIKFLPRQIAANEEEKQRFKIEAQAAAALNHSHIATIHAIEKTAEETFIVMEYIEGQELKDRIDAGPLPIDDCLTLGLQIAQGLQAAHEKGVVHRDIKSANIMLTSKGEVKIMDFGLAKLRGQSKLTQAGTTLGTVAYMSPEQTRGEDVDQRSDIFSLGVLLYEMVTGQLPFQGDYDQAVTYSILNEDPEPVTGLRTGIPMELERIIGKCLRKEPSGRYQHADELIADLGELKKEAETKAYLSKTGQKPIQQNRPGPDGRKDKRAILIPAMIGAGILLVLLGYWFMGGESTPIERVPIAVVDFVNETQEPELSGLSGMLITALEQSRRLDVLSRARMFDELKKMGHEEVTFIDESLGREIAKNANVQALAIATIRKFDNLYTIDFKVMDPQTGDHLFTANEQGEGQKSIPGMIDKLSDKTRIDLKESENVVQMAKQGIAEVTTTNLEAYNHYFQGEQLMNRLDHQAAQTEYEKAIALDSSFALAYYGLAYAINWGFGNEALARGPLQKALSLIDRIPQKEKYLLRSLDARINRGSSAALVVLKQMERVYPNEKVMLFQIGDRALHSGQFAIAHRYFNRVLQQDPQHEPAVQHMAWTLNNVGQFEEARPLIEQLAKLNPYQGFYTWGIHYIEQGDFDKAVGYLSKALEIRPDLPDALNRMSHVHNLAGRHDEALKFSKKLQTAGNPSGYFIAAWTHFLKGDFASSLQTLEAGLREYPKDVNILQSVGWILKFGIGDIDKAKAHFGGMTAADQPEAVQREGVRALADFYAVNGQIGKMEEMFEQLASFAAADKDSNALFNLLADKSLNQFWARRDKVALENDIEKIEPLADLENSIHSALLTNMYILADRISMAREKMDKAKMLHYSWSMTINANMAFASGQWQETINKVDEWVKLNPLENTKFGYYRAAQAYFEMGDLDRSIERAKESLAYIGWDGHWTQPYTLHLLGRTYEKKGKTKLAIESYEKFLELWKNADDDLPDVIHAKARLASLRGS